MNRYNVRGSIVVIFDDISEIVDAIDEEQAVAKALEIHQSKYKTAYVDWEDGEDSEEPEVEDLGLVPEDQMMLRLPAKIAPQLSGFERRKAT